MAELTVAHYVANTERLDRISGGPASERYQYMRRAFQAGQGEIIQEWWAVARPAGVILTAKPGGSLRRPGRDPIIRLHRFTDYLTDGFQETEAGRLLYAGDNIALRSIEVVKGSPQRVGLAHLFGLASGLAAVLDSVIQDRDRRRASDKKYDEEAEAVRSGQRVMRAVDWYRSGIEAADAYYRQTAARTAQIFYFGGMVFGAFVITLLTFIATALLAAGLDMTDVEILATDYWQAVAAVFAGALGAVVSAMWRITSGDFRSDYEAGPDHLRMIGGFRPFIGAVFGLGVYFATKAGVLSLGGDNPNFYFLTFMAFLGGFSERFAPDVFGAAERHTDRDTAPRSIAPANHDLGQRPLAPPTPSSGAQPNDDMQKVPES